MNLKLGFISASIVDINGENIKCFVRGLGKAVNLNCFSDEIHALPTIKKFIIC
jgi:hypothetical protein